MNISANTKKRVLIVDDENSITKMMAMMLETRGYQVETAASGSEAIDKAYSQPDLILLDLILPDLEGFEVCRRLRNTKATRHIPIIIISVKYMFEDKIEGLYLGADDYLTKPFDHEELFARMEAILRRSIIFDDNPDNKDAIIMELKKIIGEELITPFYQPIFSLKPFKLLGLEALSRPPAKSILANPDMLFKAALQCGVYCDLEMIAWRKALKSVPPHPAGTKLFLNCNPYLVESPKFFKIKTIFEERNFDVHQVVLEITERSAISDFLAFYERLRFYRDYGFGIAIDDVGGGYASLESIVETKPQVVKIDTHLVNKVSEDPLKKSLIKFMVAFCKENNAITVAEGVENKEDLSALFELGVDAAQGYLLCRPMPELNVSEIYKDIHVRLNIQPD